LIATWWARLFVTTVRTWAKNALTQLPVMIIMTGSWVTAFFARHVCSPVDLASPQYSKDMGLIFRNPWTKRKRRNNSIRRPQLQFFISSKPLNDHGSIDIEVYLIALKSSTFNSLSKTFTTILIRKLSSREVLSGTELMGESYRQLFRDFLLEYNNGKRWWYVLDSDETDNSSLANLIGTTKRSLSIWWWVKNWLNGTDNRHHN
jgi:hypothetical protein